MELIDLMCQRAMQAAADIITTRRMQPAVDADALARALQERIAVGYDGLVAEMRAADECHMGAAMLATILGVGCRQFAIDALKQIGALP